MYKISSGGRKRQEISFLVVSVQLVVVVLTCGWAKACDDSLPPFQGFGVFLGAVGHFANSPKDTVDQVVDRVYSDLGIRHYRISYESQFSPEPNNYTISCALSSFACTWIQILDTISKYDKEDDKISVIASIWSPPHYMKNPLLNTLKESHEQDFYYFIKNITEIIKQRFNGLQIEKVSPVNEPENFVASWEHTNMMPNQLCRMVKAMNDSLVSLCPENSYFWMSELYANYTDEESGVSCRDSCDTYATHGYTLDIDYWSPYRLYAYYDPGKYSRFTSKPIWLTEVSSTFPRLPTVANQLKEGLDLATNVVNFVGTSCVQRYYFWSMYTDGDSGESLIWGNFSENSTLAGDQVLYYPKTYHIYKHFTKASFGGDKYIKDCKIRHYPISSSNSQEEQLCLKFADKINNTSITVFLNKGEDHVKLEGAFCMPSSPLCCTAQEFDWWCTAEDDEPIILPKKSVCSCQTRLDDNSEFIANSDIFSNEV